MRECKQPVSLIVEVRCLELNEPEHRDDSLEVSLAEVLQQQLNDKRNCNHDYIDDQSSVVIGPVTLAHQYEMT